MNGPAITQRPRVAPDRWEAAVCSWPDNEARGWARDLMQAARQNGAVNAVVATGSAVRDVDRSDDLDLVLVYQEARPSLPRPPISVDLRCYDQADVSARLIAGHSYLSWAVRFGRVLFERDQWWRSRVRLLSRAHKKCGFTAALASHGGAPGEGIGSPAHLDVDEGLT